MTTGQRIAAKRKERNLSQEALGEALGVSRQSIYKWESDASLPDIDKLVALSRLFSVPVGWLLGVEEEPEASAETFSDEQLQRIEDLLHRYQQANLGQLSEAQQEQVEELVARRLAESKPRPSRLRRFAAVVGVLVLCYGAFILSNRLDQMDGRYQLLQNSISSVSSSVNGQIGSIANRVENILKAQNALTADYSCEFKSWDLAANTVTFTVRVVPKTYVEGMEVLFLADNGKEVTELAGTINPGYEFTGDISCGLTDSITLSAVFLSGDTRQTQLLDSYYALYSNSLPYTDLRGLEASLMHLSEKTKDGLYHVSQNYGWLQPFYSENNSARVVEYKTGLFHNFQLVTWLEETEQPPNYHGNFDHAQFYRLPELTLALEEGDILHFAVFLTDQYGRTAICASLPVFEVENGEITWQDGGSSTDFEDLDRYTFD